MKYAKPMLSAFLIGGVFAVVGQAITMLWLPVLGGESPLLGLAVLVSMGIVGVIMFMTGLHQKLAPIAGFGLVLPFNGFCAAISDTYVNVSKATGSSAAGTKAALGLVAYVIGWGVLSILTVAVVAFFVGRVM